MRIGLLKALLPFVAGCFGFGSAWADDTCPTGPFETDTNVIAAAIAAQPLKPHVRDASRDDISQLSEVTDGAGWASAGGLLNYGSIELAYDAKRYVVVFVQGAWPPRDYDPSRVSGRQLPNQVIRNTRHGFYVTTVARPTPAQARRFACLANRLVMPSSTGEVVDKCYVPPSEQVPDTDGHMGFWGFKTGGAWAKYNQTISCAAREDMGNQMTYTLAHDPIDEAMARANGTWRARYIRNIAIDSADNLYLLVDPGTLNHWEADIYKVAPSGKVTRVSPPILGPPIRKLGAFTVDERGHSWIPLTEPEDKAIGTHEGGEIYDIDAIADSIQMAPVQREEKWHYLEVHSIIDDVAVDRKGSIYALNGSRLLKLSAKGASEPFAVLPERKRSWWSSVQPSHVIVGSDGILFVDDTTSDVIFKVSQDGAVAVLAGTAGKKGTTDGPGTSALFNSPQGLALGPDGTLYVADTGNQTIRRVTPDGRVSTAFGVPGKRGRADGDRRTARLDAPESIAIDSAGTLYVVRGDDSMIRKLAASGEVTTVDMRSVIEDVE
jgi:DNA-binding beta-propeller fold protein YncE